VKRLRYTVGSTHNLAGNHGSNVGDLDLYLVNGWGMWGSTPGTAEMESLRGVICT
jgi:hypothetical protein